MITAEVVEGKDTTVVVNNIEHLHTRVGTSNIEVIEKLHTKLTRYCMSLTESKWDAEDLVQDTWIKAMVTLKWIGHSNPEAFLFRIAKNTWIDHARRKTVMARIIEAELPRLSADQWNSNNSDEIEAAFQALTKYLSPLQSAVFLIRDVFGFSSQETAGLLRTTEGAVKAALHRARHSLILVRSDIESEVAIPLPIEEDLKALLRSLASAYEMGNITTLVALIMQDDVEPAVAIGLIQNRRIQSITGSGKKARPHSVPSPMLRMTA
jgi:RNA polymerase sigma factor (sigma-70 family)